MSDSDRKQLRFLLTAVLTASFVVLVAFIADSGYGQQGAPPNAATLPADKPEMASRNQREAIRKIKYGDWQKFCFETPGNNTVCRTTISGTFDTGQSAVRVDLIEREGKARLQLFLPVGMYLQAGVKLFLDQGKPYQLPYVWCMTNTCVAGKAVDPQLIHAMEKSGKLTVEVVDSSVQSVSTELPLGQFALVRNGAPARTFQQDIDE